MYGLTQVLIHLLFVDNLLNLKYGLTLTQVLIHLLYFHNGLNPMYGLTLTQVLKHLLFFYNYLNLYLIAFQGLTFVKVLCLEKLYQNNIFQNKMVLNLNI